MKSPPSVQGAREPRGAVPEPIAITGYGLTTCLGAGLDANWIGLREGRSGLGPIGRFPVSDLPVKDGGEAPPPPAELRAAFPPELDFLAQLARVSQEALRMAGMEAGGEDRRAGLVVGSSLAASETSERFFRSYLGRGPAGADYRALEGYYIEDHLARLLRFLSLRGPAQLISNACAAGGSALARGAELIRAGRCDRVLACGYDALSPFTHAGFGSLMALSRERPRPFGARRDGMHLGDGYAAVHLEPLRAARQARRPVQAILSGHGESADAYHLTHPHPEGLGAALAMRRALAMAGLPPEDIDYLNCHGTATPSNDEAELRAMREVFGKRLEEIPINASKPNFGHTLGGAGTVEAVVTLLVLKHQRLPPTLNLEEAEPGLDLAPVGRPASLTHAMSNSFGFGGCNASLILSRASGEER